MRLIMGGLARSRDLADPADSDIAPAELRRLALWCGCLADVVAEYAERVERDAAGAGVTAERSSVLSGDRLFTLPPAEPRRRQPRRESRREAAPLLLEQQELFQEIAEVPAVGASGQLQMLEPQRAIEGLDAMRAAEASRFRREFEAVLDALRAQHAMTPEEERVLRQEERLVARIAARDDVRARLLERVEELRERPRP